MGVNNVTEFCGVVPDKSAAGLQAPPDRERLCNDMMNTSVMAALVGGFSLGNLQPLGKEDPPGIDVAIYMLNVVAVHSCTCSCLMSALLYGVMNRLRDEKVEQWAASMPWKLLLQMPLPKFGMGCVCYLVSVLLLSFRDLEGAGVWRWLALAIGVMSVTSVLGTAALVKLAMKVTVH